jgi:hypothetical protein
MVALLIPLLECASAHALTNDGVDLRVPSVLGRLNLVNLQKSALKGSTSMKQPAGVRTLYPASVRKCQILTANTVVCLTKRSAHVRNALLVSGDACVIIASAPVASASTAQN